jgi:hypothetical protein
MKTPMITWTDAAQDALARYNEAMRKRVAASGADPDEVADDLRRHIEEELLASKIKIVTREEVERVLARMGPNLIDSVVPRLEPVPIAPLSAFSQKLPMVRGWLIVGAVFLTACLLTLFFFVGGSESSATLSIDDVVHMAQSYQIQPGTGIIRFGASGDALRVSITGRSTRPLPLGLKQTYEFKATGRLTESNLAVLQGTKLFAEPASTNRLVQLTASIVPLLVLLGLFGLGIGLLIALLSRTSRR